MIKIGDKRENSQRKIISNGEPFVISKGRIGAIVGYPMLVANKQDIFEEKIFEKFVRAPGTRMLIKKDKKILLQEEYRTETNSIDWRLPGGKVLDTFEEYEKYLNINIPEETIIISGKKELEEEVGLAAKNIKIIEKSVCGATVQWDLFYLLVEEFDMVKNKENHETEDILCHKWFTDKEVIEMCKNGSISEDRSVAVLLKYLL
ncbi:NUDIX domain-containing protein [Candidatus Nomurabacteria bacterium]|nr:NUDIX domain-containing protein [Candidatus Nomurabacteria bacterium]MCB9820409.1 NUDIX domain-containing protein [Candidatus Nomurabacteria bacterium]